MTSLMIRRSKPGDESCDLFKEEEEGIFNSLKRRAEMILDGLNNIDGITCQSAVSFYFMYFT